MTIREDQLNGRIATIIRECVKGTQWTIAEENERDTGYVQPAA